MFAFTFQACDVLNEIKREMKRIDSPTPVQLSRGRTNQGRKKKKKRENICDLRTYLRKKAFLKVTAFNCHSSKSEIKSKAVSPVR